MKLVRMQNFVSGKSPASLGTCVMARCAAMVAVAAGLFGMTAMAEQPDEFITYVQNDGTQYFDTGVIGKAYTKAEIDYVPETIPGNGVAILGSRSTQTIALWFNNYGFGLHYWGDLINNVARDVGVRRTLINTVEPGNQTVQWIQGGTNFVKTKTGAYSTDLSMYLFALNNNGTANLCNGILRLYGLKIWQKDSAEGEYSLVRDYRPAIKDGKACLYDDVNKTLIYPKAADGSETTIPPTIRRVYSTTHDGMTPIQQLTNAVTKAAAGDIVELERGVYTFPDDVYMADNTLAPSSASYCKFRLNVTKPGIVIRGEDDSNRRTWTHGDEPVVIDGNGAKAIQIQLAEKQSARVENIAFANCYGGAYGPNNESGYGSKCNGGAIGIGTFANYMKGGDNVVISNCVFRGNRSSIGGAIGSNSGNVKYILVQDCFFTNNMAERYGGCITGGNISGCDFIGNGSGCSGANNVSGCRFIANNTQAAAPIAGARSITDCLFVTNVIRSGEWVYVASATNFYNCHFTNNNGAVFGAIGVETGSVVNCTFHHNASGNQGRGAITDASLVSNCIITCNGGYSAGGLTIRTAGIRTYVKDCYFGGNWAGDGGGAACYKRDLAGFSAEDLVEPVMMFENCTFETNFVSSGRFGGAIENKPSNLPEGIETNSLVVCTNCHFIGNSGSHAGGVSSVTAIGCVFDGNVALMSNRLGTDAAYSRLVDCDLNGGNLYHCSVDRSRVHDVTNYCAFNLGCHVTNTLVSGCVFSIDSSGIIGRYYYTAVDSTSEFVNCTFVANKGHTFYNTNMVNLVNCAFFDNTNRVGTVSAISFNGTATNDGAITFDTCAFGPIASGVPSPIGVDMYMNVVPFFCAGRKGYEDEPYYSPRLSSSLCGLGKTLDYTEFDIDLAGRPRVRDGKVDIGCYECWLKPRGFSIGIK